MDPISIIALVTKAAQVANVLLENKEDITSIAKTVFSFVLKNDEGSATQADYDAVDAELDAELAKFNAPLPPE